MRKIPKQIELAGNTIEVIVQENLYELGEKYADWDAKTNVIRVQTPGKDFSRDAIFAAYFHEVEHAKLEIAGHIKLSEDESFVERMGQLAYQAEKSRKYP